MIWSPIFFFPCACPQWRCCVDIRSCFRFWGKLSEVAWWSSEAPLEKKCDTHDFWDNRIIRIETLVVWNIFGIFIPNVWFDSDVFEWVEKTSNFVTPGNCCLKLSLNTYLQNSGLVDWCKIWVLQASTEARKERYDVNIPNESPYLASGVFMLLQKKTPISLGIDQNGRWSKYGRVSKLFKPPQPTLQQFVYL